ncbi:MAG: signal peptidase I [Candidatus Woesearchaeota archaeon]
MNAKDALLTAAIIAVIVAGGFFALQTPTITGLAINQESYEVAFSQNNIESLRISATTNQPTSIYAITPDEQLLIASSNQDLTNACEQTCTLQGASIERILVYGSATITEIRYEQTSPQAIAATQGLEILETNDLQGIAGRGSTFSIKPFTQEPQRNDLVALSNEREGTVFTVIKALPQDTFVVENNQLYINEELARNTQNTPYRISDRAAALLRLYENDYNNQIPTDAYLVLGNNAETDTGSARFGLVHKDALLGIASIEQAIHENKPITLGEHRLTQQI